MNTTQNTANPLGYERIGKLLTRYAVPSIISLIIIRSTTWSIKFLLVRGSAFWETAQQILLLRLPRLRLRSPRCSVMAWRRFSA